MPLRLMMVDDDESCHVIHQLMLEKSGVKAELSQFVEAQKALDELRSNLSDGKALPHFILLDINMPGMDGFEFLNEFQLLDFRTPPPSVYMVSHSDSENDKSKAREYIQVKGFQTKFLEPTFFKNLQNQINND